MNKEENNKLWGNARGRSESDMPPLTVDNLREFCQRKAQLEWTLSMVGASPGELRELDLINKALINGIDNGTFDKYHVNDIVADFAVEYDPDKEEEFAIKEIDRWLDEQRRNK